MKQVTLIFLACFLWLTCSSVAFSENAQISKLEPVTVASDASVTMFTAEIADTEELRQRGLMFRHLLPDDKAMLFDYGQPRPVAMWMKNTNISLDMLFIREDGTIAAIAENTVPQSLDTISVQEPVRGVLEMAAGTVKRLGLKQNDRVYHRIFRTLED
jgi:uncharacterized membrane protein (UPF0127 family)